MTATEIELASLDALIDEGLEDVAELCKAIARSPREPMDWLCGATGSKIAHRKLREGLMLSVEVMYRGSEPVYVRLWLEASTPGQRAVEYKREAKASAEILSALGVTIPNIVR